MPAEIGHVARQLHDGVAQALFVIGATTESLLREGNLAEGERTEILRVHELARAAIGDLRDAIDTLRRSAK